MKNVARKTHIARVLGIMRCNEIKPIAWRRRLKFLAVAAGIFFANISAYAAIPASEQAVLDSFYSSTNGASWTNNTNWENGGDPCSTTAPWYGVTCDFDSNVNSYVIGVVLNGNNLTGSLPSLAGLTRLLNLHVDNNQLTGSIPSLSALIHLEEFSASNNRLTGLIPYLSSALQPNLLIFDVSKNQLTGNIPPLSGMISMKEFRVGGNQLSGEIESPPPYLTPGQSSLCDNWLIRTSNSDWDAATAAYPWYGGCELPATTTTLTTSSPPFIAGQTIVLTATIASALTSYPNPFTGEVAFVDGNETICTTVSDNGQATCSVSTLTIGTHSIFAVFNGDNGNTASYSDPPISLEVQSTPPLLNGTCGSDNGGTFATLSASDANLCSAGTVSGFTVAGPWTWSCIGTGGGATATCSANKQIQTLVEPAIALSFNPGSVTTGGTSTLTVNLSNPNPVPLQLNSSVTITGLPGGASLDVVASNPTVACGSNPNTGFPVVIPAQSGSTPGNCTLTFANISAGTAAGSFTATWPANVQFITTGSTATVNTTITDTATLIVTAAVTPIDGTCGSDNGGTFATLSSSDANLCSAGTASAFAGSGPWTWSCVGTGGGATASCQANLQTAITTWTVSASAGSNGTITPAMQTVNNGAVATFTVTSNAGYSANVTGCGGSLSGNVYTTAPVTADCAVTASFTALAPVGTTTTLSMSPNPAIAGQPITFSVSVDPTSTPAPTGTVSVTGAGLNCAATLTAINATTSNGSCTLTFANAGAYAITATYSGDAIYASSSAILNLTVNAAATSNAAVPAPTLSGWVMALLGLLLGGIGIFRRNLR